MTTYYIAIGWKSVWVLVFVLCFSSCCEQEIAEMVSSQPEAEWNELGPENWEAVDYGMAGSVAWREGVLQIDGGESLLGGCWKDELPIAPYEVELQAKRVSGNDFFCGLTVPVRGREEAVTLVLGGWGGSVTGISSIDEKDASDNETTSYRLYKDDHWYHIRMEVCEDRLAAWIDGEQIVEMSLLGKKLSLHAGPIEACASLGVATWQTAAEMKGVRWRTLPER